MNNEQWVWCIGGGMMQLPMIELARARGYRVLLTDGSQTAVGRQGCDEFIQVSTYDLYEHERLARASKRVIKACVASAIDVGHVSAAVADILKLPSLGAEVASILGDKIRLQVALQQEYPMRYCGEPEMYATELWSKWFIKCNSIGIRALPCVIKATDNCGTRGIYKVSTLTEFGDAVPRAYANNKSSTRVLIEECLDIESEYSSDWFVKANGEVIQVNGSKRFFSLEHFGVEVMYLNPWRLPSECVTLAQHLVDTVKVPCGPIKIDFALDKQHRWCIIEAAPRWSGGFDHNFAYPLSTGKDLVSVNLDWALGNEISDTRISWPEEHGWTCGVTPLYAPGQIIGWHGVTEARALLENSGYVFDRQLTRISATDRPIFILARCVTQIEAQEKAQYISELIQPIYGEL